MRLFYKHPDLSAFYLTEEMLRIATSYSAVSKDQFRLLKQESTYS